MQFQATSSSVFLESNITSNCGNSKNVLEASIQYEFGKTIITLLSHVVILDLHPKAFFLEVTKSHLSV